MLRAHGDWGDLLRDDWVRVLLFESPTEHEVYRAGVICGNGLDQLCIGHCDLAGCKRSLYDYFLRVFDRRPTRYYGWVLVDVSEVGQEYYCLMLLRVYIQIVNPSVLIKYVGK